MSQGHVAVTTRLSNFSALFESLELDVLAPGDAVDFLIERTDGRRRKADNDRAEALALAGDVGALALALEQACAYICKRRTSFAEYRKVWASESAKLMGFHDETVTAIRAPWR